MVFNTDISSLLYILLIAASVLMPVSIAITALRLGRLIRRRKRSRSVDVEDSAPIPDVSIIVYSRDDADNLSTLLPQLLGQRYNGRFEVIVVNEGSSESTRMAVGALQVDHPNLYLTFTPDGARSLSRKKLAITLGVKAAQYPVVVLTMADARIASDVWLADMTRHFNDAHTDVVLGYATPVFKRDASMMRTMHAFDYFADNEPWLFAALTHHPYRGSSYNMAYRRDVFFANKGFSRSLNLREGDDDIFVSEICNGRNTVLEVTRDATVEPHIYNFAHRLHYSRVSHAFTGRRVTSLYRRTMLAAIWMSIMAMACAGVALALSPANLLVLIWSAIVILIALVADWCLWGKALRVYDVSPLLLTLPLWLYSYPVRDFAMRLRARLGKSEKHYTWT